MCATRGLFGWKVLALCLLTLAAAMVLHPATVQAQGPAGENDYVDVAVTLEFNEENGGGDREVFVIVMNHGSRTAYDVEVVVDIVYPANSSYWRPNWVDVSVGTWALEGTLTPGSVGTSQGGGYTFRWNIPELGGLERERGRLRIRNSDNPVGDPNLIFDKSLDLHEIFGEVTTSSFESEIHKGNNTDRFWYALTDHVTKGAVRAKGDYSVGSVSVDEHHPSPGEIVNFTFEASPAHQLGGRRSQINFDSKVTIDLTDGLTIDEDPSASPPREVSYTANGYRGPKTVSYSNGVFNIGTRKGDNWVSTLSATLPIRVASDAVVNEQCITVTISGKPPPGPGPFDDDISDNVAKLCLGDQPADPLKSNQVDVFTIFPCVGNTNPPCDSTDDVRVRAKTTSLQRILTSGNTIVHVQDKPNRKYDAHANSVNAANRVSWQIPVIWDGSELDTINTQWTNYRDAFTASGSNGGAPPGSVHIRAFEDTTFQIIYKMTPGTTPPWTGEDAIGYNPGSDNGPFTYNAEFEKLGTYKLQITAKLTRATAEGDENCDPDSSNVNQRFCASETYTFVVGPMADLAVRDGGASSGASSYVAADRDALTVVAVNNGPTHPTSARVTGLPMGAVVLYISEGSYDGTAGVWDIDELRPRDWYRSAGRPEPTLVLAAAAGDTATVSIASPENYEVCVGPKSDPGDLPHTTKAACEAVANASWNSTPVYDYNAANNTTTITATRGVGGGGSGVPGLQGATANSRSVSIAWEAVRYLYGVGVGHYEVQKFMSGAWETLQREVGGTEFTDFNVGSEKVPVYRVRAVNEAGVAGPWSGLFDRLVSQRGGQLAAPSLTVRTTTDDTIRLRWTAPSNHQDAVTGYELEYLVGGSWTLLESLGPTVTSFEDLELDSGTERSYRVRAMAGADPGRWSNEATAFTPPGEPALFWAEPNGPNAILITWAPPGDASSGGTVTRYELEVSTDDGDTYSRLPSPGARDRTYNHAGLRPGDTRQYRMRGCNSAGCGDWSFPASAATAAEGVPAAPGLSARANSASEIRLSWSKPNDGGSEISRYQLEHYTDDGDWTDLDDNLGSHVTEYLHQDDFGGGTTHRYRMRAVNANGDGAWSAVRTVTISAQAPGKPELSFGGATDDTLTLEWTTPPTNGSRITGYQVERNDRVGGYDNWVRIATTGASVTNHTDRGLYSGEYYCYRVAANSSAGVGPYSDEDCEDTTGEYARSPDPPVARLSSVSTNRVTITWDPPADDGGRPVTHYVYEMAPFHDDCEYAIWDRELWPTDPEKCFVKSPNDRTVSFSSLAPGESYSFRVRTGTVYGDGDWTTLTAHLPVAADDPETTDVTEDLQVRVSTTSVNVNEGGAETRYTVRLSKAPAEGETVRLNWRIDGDDDIYVTYPDNDTFDKDNWNTGLTFTLSAAEDRDSDNGIVVMRHTITVGQRTISGPDVRVVERDND
ncbi:MAG: fibronectin type III domain-containing protein [bacterium]|nr:fibronectin type III domain-containing protein [bacterium]